jgi:hypothetical protein
MRKTAAGILTSLDGVVESPEGWHLRYSRRPLHREVDE